MDFRVPHSKVTQVLEVFMGHSDSLLLVCSFGCLTLILKPSTEQLGQSISDRTVPKPGS